MFHHTPTTPLYFQLCMQHLAAGSLAQGAPSGRWPGRQWTQGITPTWRGWASSVHPGAKLNTSTKFQERTLSVDCVCSIFLARPKLQIRQTRGVTHPSLTWTWSPMAGWFPSAEGTPWPCQQAHISRMRPTVASRVAGGPGRAWNATCTPFRLEWRVMAKPAAGGARACVATPPPLQAGALGGAAVRSGA